MESEFGKYVSSPLFTFIVGQARKEITVHSGPLASLSSTLDKLINGPMLEAKLRQADWSEVVEEDTFVRLCEYAYMRDYTPPVCLEREVRSFQTPISPQNFQSKKLRKKNGKNRCYSPCPVPASAMEHVPVQEYPEAETYEVAVSAEPADAQVESEEQPYAPFEGFALPYREKSIWSGRLRDKFRDLSVRYTRSNNNALSGQRVTFTPTGNTHPWEDFTSVFLGHAKLYILADTYGITSLADLVLHKLATTLTDFTLCEDNINDVAELVRFSYRGTLPHDAMRALVTAYVASVLGQIGDNTQFQELLAEGGDFVLDFWQVIWG
ncbi:hypothetical protein BJX99DRAFT_267834 [Aspergillus californicus]